MAISEPDEAEDEILRNFFKNFGSRLAFHLNYDSAAPRTNGDTSTGWIKQWTFYKRDESTIRKIKKTVFPNV
jgi:hypothetical protein